MARAPAVAAGGDIDADLAAAIAASMQDAAPARAAAPKREAEPASGGNPDAEELRRVPGDAALPGLAESPSATRPTVDRPRVRLCVSGCK